MQVQRIQGYSISPFFKIFLQFVLLLPKWILTYISHCKELQFILITIQIL